MASEKRRVVITGMGQVSPLGLSLDAFWSALESGKGAVGPIHSFKVEGLANHIGAEVPPFDPKALAMEKHRKPLGKNKKYMARDIQLAVGAAELAIAHAGIHEGKIDPTRIGIDLGAGLISSDLDELAPAINAATRPDGEFDYHVYGEKGISMIDPLWLLKYLPNMLACHIGLLNDCQGPSNSITEGESAPILAMGESLRILQRNRADVMVTGGGDSKIHPLSVIRMTMNHLYSRWDGPPDQACRPFDRQRSGGVPGEGAGILLFEEREHALGRGATIHAEVLGFGSGCDARPDETLDPEGRGLEIAMRAALRDAGLAPSEIGHVNAHGYGGVDSDRAEARAIRRVFGDVRVPVTAMKGFFGNMASGGGSVEMIGSILGASRGLIPPTINCDDLDPDCDIDVVRGSAATAANPIFLKLSFTRHGQAAAMVIRAEA